MAGFSSSIASSGGGGNPQFGDPSQLLQGGPGQSQGQQGSQPGAPPAGPSQDFVQNMARMGMEIEQKIDALSGQFPEATDDLRTAKLALKKGMAKILTTSSQASGGPQAPRTV